MVGLSLVYRWYIMWRWWTAQYSNVFTGVFPTRVLLKREEIKATHEVCLLPLHRDVL